MVWKTFALPETQRGLILRDGSVVKWLEPGRHKQLDPFGRLQLVRFHITNPAIPREWAERLERLHPEMLQGRTLTVRPEKNTLALVSLDGTPHTVIRHGYWQSFWTLMHRVEVETIDLETADRIDPLEADRWKALVGLAIVQAQITSHQTGLVYVDGRVTERLAPGRYAFWAANRAVRVETFDLRPETHDVVAQEILTKDRVTVRVNLTALTRILDPEALVKALPDRQLHLHRLVQLAAREAIGGRTLDELLKARVDVDQELTAKVRARLKDAGLEIADVRIKDVILPGDMREMLNKVVEAEKAAEANLIQRREETAATRSLLNTARLMENHPTLMRLKELEALERLTEKVGRIDVHQTAAGTGLPALLDTLMGANRKGDAKVDAN